MKLFEPKNFPTATNEAFSLWHVGRGSSPRLWNPQTQLLHPTPGRNARSGHHHPLAQHRKTQPPLTRRSRRPLERTARAGQQAPVQPPQLPENDRANALEAGQEREDENPKRRRCRHSNRAKEPKAHKSLEQVELGLDLEPPYSTAGRRRHQENDAPGEPTTTPIYTPDTKHRGSPALPPPKRPTEG